MKQRLTHLEMIAKTLDARLLILENFVQRMLEEQADQRQYDRQLKTTKRKAP